MNIKDMTCPKCGTFGNSINTEENKKALKKRHELVTKYGLEIQPVLCVSTIHMTKKDSELLWKHSYIARDEYHWPMENQFIHNDVESSPLIVKSTDYGYIISTGTFEDEEYFSEEIVPSLKEEGFSDALINLLRIALETNCWYLKLDADGQIYDKLKTFEW